MELPNEKALDFYSFYFSANNSLKNSLDNQIQQHKHISKFNNQLQHYRSQSINCPKQISQYSFVKKYQIVCSLIPYVSTLRPDQLETNQILSVIQITYDNYLLFIKNGLWKIHNRNQSHLQQFALFVLHEMYNRTDIGAKKRAKNFDRYVLSFFYTINILKACSKYVKVFANFVASAYSFGQVFVYICLKNISNQQSGQYVVTANTMKKIIKIFQSEDNHQYSRSLNSSRELDSQQQKKISINSIFTDPIGSNLAIPKLKMFKIMKICNVIQSKQENERIQWSEFLAKYFELVQQKQISFGHIVCAAVAKSTFQMSKKLLGHQQPHIQQQFLQQAFGYVFQILQLVQSDVQQQIGDEKTQRNINSLRKHYYYMKQLNQHNITALNKFTKKILKNNFILHLYKKYS